jgi:hypothetical protein
MACHYSCQDNLIALDGMWTRKSSQELSHEQRASYAHAGLGAITVVFLACIIGIPHAGFKAPTSVRVVAMFAEGVLLLAWRERARWRRKRSGVVICEQCNRIMASKTRGTCVCGGTLTPMLKMKWLDLPLDIRGF